MRRELYRVRALMVALGFGFATLALLISESEPVAAVCATALALLCMRVAYEARVELETDRRRSGESRS